MVLYLSVTPGIIAYWGIVSSYTTVAGKQLHNLVPKRRKKLNMYV